MSLGRTRRDSKSRSLVGLNGEGDENLESLHQSREISNKILLTRSSIGRVSKATTTTTTTGYTALNEEFLEDKKKSSLSAWNGGKGQVRVQLSNYALLIGLYFLQGIPLGLVHGTMPYLLKSKAGNELTFTDLGLFSLAGYPYSLKLLWSPMVDSYFFPRIGRRKTWIIPTQLLIGIGLLWISTRVDEWISNADADITRMTFTFMLLIFLCATQDIAVDGWALTLLDSDQVHYSSTCQTIGLNSGYFVAFTVFLALNSPEFCNTYFGRDPVNVVGIIEIASFLKFWGLFSILGTIMVAFMKREDAVLSSMQQFVPRNIIGAYSTIYRIVSLPNVRRLGLVLLFMRLGFTAVDSIFALKLIERGFPREKLALTVLIDFPCQIVLGFLAARWTRGSRPLWAWQRALFFKFGMAFMAMLVLGGFPMDGIISSTYFLSVAILTVLSSFASTIIFVSMSAFFSTISDPSIGGTYMTLLNTLSNLGGMWPKLFIMSAVDWFTVRNCILPPPNGDGGGEEGTRFCITEYCKSQCQASGGTLSTLFDGFYIVNSTCILLGVTLAITLLIPLVKKLEIVPPRLWQVNNNNPLPIHLAGIV